MPVIRMFSFVGSCAGASSHTKELSDRLAAAFADVAARHGETVSYDCVTADQLRVDFCRSCASCFSNKPCPLDAADDMGDLKRRLLEADVILFGTPVYYAGMSGVTKSVLDRIAFWTHRLELAGKVGMALVTTSNNHGTEVEQRLSELLRFTGMALPEGIYLQTSQRPRLGKPEEAEPVIAEAATRLWSAWEEPGPYLTEQQGLYWKGLMQQTLRASMRHLLFGQAMREDLRILYERDIVASTSLVDYVLERRKAGTTEKGVG